VSRTLTLKYSAHRRTFTGVLKAAAAPLCAAARAVSIRKSGQSRPYGTATTTQSGSYKLHKRAGRGRYFASVPLEVVPDLAECGARKSTTQKVS
jgi:hypothetical protein